MTNSAMCSAIENTDADFRKKKRWEFAIVCLNKINNDW